MSLREVVRMALGRRSILGGLARWQAITGGLVARGLEPADVPEPFPRKAPAPKPPPDPEENRLKMAAFVSSFHRR